MIIDTPTTLKEMKIPGVTCVLAENGCPPGQVLITQILNHLHPALCQNMRFTVFLHKAAELLGLIVRSSPQQSDPASLLPGRIGLL